MLQISSGRLGRPKTSVVPSGVIDGANVVFLTPDKFLHTATNQERVYLRGKRLFEGIGNDYIASESGGPGTGYDTLIFAAAPRVGDNLLLDYYPAS